MAVGGSRVRVARCVGVHIYVLLRGGSLRYAVEAATYEQCSVKSQDAVGGVDLRNGARAGAPRGVQRAACGARSGSGQLAVANEDAAGTRGNSEARAQPPRTALAQTANGKRLSLQHEHSKP